MSTVVVSYKGNSLAVHDPFLRDWDELYENFAQDVYRCGTAVSFDWFMLPQFGRLHIPRKRRSRGVTAVEALAAPRIRNEAAIQLLDEWLADESGYDEEVWPRVKAAIEENRLSYRRRFND